MYLSYQDYRKAWNEAYEIDPPIPLNIDIELASLCSLSCSFCYWGESQFKQEMQSLDYDGLPKKRFMPKELAFRLIDESSALGVPALKMNARGESTLHPNYSDILIYAKEKKTFFDILVNTHGNCKEEIIPGLMAATKVMISLDSLDPEIYPKMRIGGKLNKAIWTIMELKRRNHPNLWIRRVISEINKNEPFVEKCKKLFGDDINVSEHFEFDRNRNIKVSIHGDDPNRWERDYCLYPSQRLVVTSSGQVLPCCIDWRSEMVVGNIYKEKLIDIWNGKSIRKLRKMLRENKLHNASKICQGCTSYLAYKRPERRFVQDVKGKAEIDTIDTKQIIHNR